VKRKNIEETQFSNLKKSHKAPLFTLFIVHKVTKGFHPKLQQNNFHITPNKTTLKSTKTSPVAPTSLRTPPIRPNHPNIENANIANMLLFLLESEKTKVF
jgi:hypothetical protein